MSWWMIAFVGVVYLITCLMLAKEGRPGMALAFFGYALANVGLVWDVMRG